MPDVWTVDMLQHLANELLDADDRAWLVKRLTLGNKSGGRGMAVLKADNARHSIRYEGDTMVLMWHDAEKGLTPLAIEQSDEQVQDLIQSLSRARANRRKQLKRAQLEEEVARAEAAARAADPDAAAAKEAQWAQARQERAERATIADAAEAPLPRITIKAPVLAARKAELVARAATDGEYRGWLVEDPPPPDSVHYDAWLSVQPPIVEGDHDNE